jgi:hypothetical protein
LLCRLAVIVVPRALHDEDVRFQLDDTPDAFGIGLAATERLPAVKELTAPVRPPEFKSRAPDQFLNSELCRPAALTL